MTIYGVDRHFRLTVGAYKDIASMLPSGDINDIWDLIRSEDPFIIMDTIFSLAIRMNKQYEIQQSFMEPGYKKNRPLTREELETLSLDEVTGPLREEVMQRFIDSQKQEVELKKQEAEAGGSSTEV